MKRFNLKAYRSHFLFTLILFLFSNLCFSITSNGTGGGAWSAGATWVGGIAPVAGDVVLIADGDIVVLDVDIAGAGLSSLTIGGGTSGTLTIGDNTTARNLLVAGVTTVSSGATFDIGNFNATHLVTLMGNLVNNGNLNFYNTSSRVANVIFTNTAGSPNYIISGNTPIFNNLTITRVAGTVTLSPSVALNIEGTFSSNTSSIFADGGLTHTIGSGWAGTGSYSGNGTLNFDGTISTISAAVSTFNNLIFSGGGAGSINNTITVNGNLTITNGTALSLGAFNLVVNGNFDASNGSYIQTSNTLTFSGTGAQAINFSNCKFWAITFSNGGATPKTLTGTNTSMGNQFIVSVGATVDGNAIISCASNFRIEGYSSLSGEVILTGGTLYNNVANTMDLGTADLTIAGTVSTLNDAITTSGNVSISGRLIMATSVTLTGIPGKTFSMTGTGRIDLAGADQFPSGFAASPTLDAGTLVYYNVASDQTIRGGLTYGNLNLNGASIKTLESNIDVVGTLTIGTGVTFDLNGTAGNNFSGAVTNNGTGIIHNGSATLNGDLAQTLSGTGTFSFIDFSISLPNPLGAVTKTISSAITVSGNFTAFNSGGDEISTLTISLAANLITGGAGSNFDLGANCILRTQATTGAASFHDAMQTFLGTITFDAASTVNYDRNGNQEMADGFDYGNIQFGNTGTKSALTPLNILGSISRTGGTPLFDDGGFTHTISGDWNLAAAYYPATTGAKGTIVFNGTNQTIAATNFYNLQISGSGVKTLEGNITLFNDLTINDGVSFDANIFNIAISGNWFCTGTGTFIQSTGTTTFNGTTANQTVSSNASSHFGHFTITKTNASFETVTALTNFDVDGNFTFTADDAIFDATGMTINVGGHWNFMAGTTFTSTNSTIIFDGASLQNIRNLPSGFFNNVEFSGAGTKLLYDNTLDINGNCTINGATVDGDNRNIDISVFGSWTNTGSLVHTGRTVFFDGTDQAIGSSSFGHVDFAGGSGTKTLGGAISLSGNLTISAGVTLDVGADYAINVAGNWINNSIFTPANGTVTLNGAPSITTGGSGAGKKFYNLIIASTGTATLAVANDLDVDNDFTITTGTFTTGNNLLYFGGNFSNAGTFNQNNNGATCLVTFDASSGTKTIDPGTTYTFRAVTFDAALPTVIYSLENNLIITNNTVSNIMTINEGTLDLNGKTMSFITNSASDYILINPGGALDVDAGAQLLLANSNRILNQGGILKIVGAPGNIASIGSYSTTGYTISQTSGEFQAKYYRFANTIGTGISIIGGTIDETTNNFSEGTFTGGAAGIGTSYLQIDIDFAGDFTATNIVFNSGPASNVRRLNTAANKIIFEDANGALSGSAFESDLGNLIDWTYPGGFFWDGGGGDSDWNNALNWSGNSVPDPTAKVYLEHTIGGVAGTYTVDINATASVEIFRLVMSEGTLFPISLVLSGGYDLDINENIIIGAGNSLTLTDNTNTLNVGGNWDNAGTLNNGSSLVTFDGPTGSYTINSGGTGAGKTFYNLTINATDATYFLASNNIDIDNDLTISDGTLDVSSGNYAMFVSGNWSNSGTGVFVPQTGTVTFDKNTGSSLQTITGGPFYNFTCSGSSLDTKQMSSNIDIDNSITIGANSILDAQTYVLYIGGNWSNASDAAGFSQTGAGTVIFDRAGNQNIDNGTAATTFNHLSLSGTSTKTFFNNTTINGDFQISASVGAVDLNTFQIDGVGGSNIFTIAGTTTLIIRNTSNFPSGFETINLASSSTVQYRADIDQDIYVTTYGNLTLLRNTPVDQTKTALGNIVVTGNLTINDVNTQLDMSANNADITLTGNLAFPPAGRAILWGATSTLTHNGAAWNIDADIDWIGTDHFNNLVLSGSGNKTELDNLTIGGNVEIQSGVTLIMGAFTITGTGSKSFSIASGAALTCANVSPGIAFPSSFGTYSLNSASTVTLNSASDQIVKTLGITYGKLTFSNNTRAITTDGLATLIVIGDFSMNTGGAFATFTDNSVDMILGGSLVYFTAYTPSSNARTITFNGTSQNIRDLQSTTLDLPNVVFSGNGTKTFGDGNDIITIGGNFTINAANTIVTCSRDLNFSGATWSSLGTFTGTANTTTFNSTANINNGSLGSFFNIAFSGATTKTIQNNGLDVNGTFNIIAGTVNMASLTHSIYGNVTNSGTWNTASANLTFDGAAQTIDPFTAQNVICSSGTGGNVTKTMNGVWNVNDLSINSSTILNTSGSNYSINITGNWFNSGTFTANSGIVAFESNNTTPKTITSGGSLFYNVTFNQSQFNSRVYTLGDNTTIGENMTIGNGATFTINGSRTLTLGSNDAGNPVGEIHTVESGGVLDISTNGTLLFEHSDTGGNPSLTINSGGTLKVLGSSGNPATISRAGGTGARTDITVNGNIEARYYLIEFIADTGMNITAGATLHATNNFSDGTWSNITTTASGTRRYLILDCPDPGNPIANVAFNFSGTPNATFHRNVKRSTASTITFTDNLTGNLGDFTFEDDADASAPGWQFGYLQWPQSTTTNWTGAINRDWNLDGNWDNLVPTANSNAIISLVANNPKITSANAVCKNLTLTNGQLILENGFDLVTNGDVTIGTATNVGILSVTDNTSEITIGGAWARGTNGVFTNGNSTVTFNSSSGSATITPLTSAFHNLVINNSISEFFLVGASLTIAGNLDITAGTLTPTTGGHTLSVGGDFNNLATYTPGTGTVVLDGATQNITGGTFYNLTVSGTNEKTTNGATSISNILTINSTLTAAGGSSIDMNGNVTINGGGTFNDGAESHTFSGAIWTNSGTYAAGTGTLTFDRTAGGQTINASSFNNLIISSTQTTTVGGNLTITGDMTIINHTANHITNLQTYTITGAAGTFTLPNTEILYVRGANNFPSGFSTYNIGATSRVQYDGVIDQTIGGGVTYGNLFLVNATVKTLSGNIAVQSTLRFNSSTLDVSSNNYKINIAGVWDNNTTGGGIFVPRSGEVVFDGSLATHSINIAATSTNNFYNLTVDKSAGTVTPSRSFTIANNLQVINGTYTANNQTTTVGGNFTAISGTYATSGTYILTKAGSTANISVNGSTILNLTINGAGTTFTLQDNLILTGNFMLTAGTFNGNSKAVELGNGAADVVSISGTYKIGAGGSLAIGNSTALSVDLGGTIEIVGSPGNLATVTRNASGGTYGFQVNGTISAQYYLFEYMNVNGIVVNSGGTIDATNHFSNGTFTNGANGGTLLKIENSQDFNGGANWIENVSFPLKPAGGSSNVYKSAASGTLEFYNATGVFAGESFDNDANNIINWSGPVVLTWNGSVSTDWYTNANWTASSGPNIFPTNAEDVVIATATNQPIIIGSSTAAAKSLTINSGANLTLTTDAVAAIDLDINGDFTISGTGSLTLSSIDDFLNVTGSWTKSATGTVNSNGTVTFDGTSGSGTINNGTATFYNLIIDGAASYQLGAATVVRNNFTINSGSLDITTNNYNITVGGSWSNAGTFTSRSGKVIFNSTSGTKTIDAGASSFFNVDINTGGTPIYQLSTNNMSTRGYLNILGNTLNLNGLTLSVGDAIAPAEYISISGTLEINDNAHLKMANGTAVTVNSGGIIKVVGTSGNIATVSRQSAGSYSFTVNSGGTIWARYYLLEYMNASGINVASGATLDATNNFSDGTFSNGAAGGNFLTINNTLNGGAGITVNNAIFNTGPTYCVSRTSGSGDLTLNDPSGTLGIYTYEQDDEDPVPSKTTGLIRWTYTFPVTTWTGAISSQWDVIGNWDAGVPDATTNAVIPSVATFPIIDAVSGAGTTLSLTLLTGALLTIDNNIDLTINADLTNAGTITINPGSTSTVSVLGQWSNTGTYNKGSSTAILTAASGTKNITQVSPFYNLQINGAGTFQLANNIDVDNNLTLSAGTLDVTTNNYQINVSGNWINNATFTSRNGTVVFDGTGTQTVQGGTGGTKAFYNFSKTGASTMTLSADLDANNNFTVSSGSINASGNVLYIAGNFSWTKSNTSLSNASIVFDGSVSKTFTYANTSIPLSLAELTINKSAGANLLLNNSITANNALKMTNGDLVLGSLNLIIGNGGNTIGGSSSSYIQADGSGVVKKMINSLVSGAILLPVGDADDYSPFTFNLIGGTLAGGAYITLNVVDAVHPQKDNPNPLSDYITRYWVLNQNGITGPIDYNISCVYVDADIEGLEGALLPSKYSITTAPNYWLSGGNVTTGTNTLAWNGVHTFSEFTGVGTVAPLPIELLIFEAKVNQDKKVELSWITASETNNDYFNVEKTLDGINFESVNEDIQGAGNSSTIQSYQTTDDNPSTGVSYYRLKQTDFDGRFEYSNLVFVEIKNDHSFNIFPNPNNGQNFNITFQPASIGQKILIIIYDANGSSVYSETIRIEESNLSLEVELSKKLASGIYHVTGTSTNTFMRKKMTVN